MRRKHRDRSASVSGPTFYSVPEIECGARIVAGVGHQKEADFIGLKLFALLIGVYKNRVEDFFHSH